MVFVDIELSLTCLCLSVSSLDLIHCTNEMNVNIPQLADSLFERTTSTSWVVVFKSLIATHHLMVYGNEVSWGLQSPLNETLSMATFITHYMICCNIYYICNSDAIVLKFSGHRQ